nr:MAG TPA: hypothetical protein [Caudoviricetes sp.]
MGVGLLLWFFICNFKVSCCVIGLGVALLLGIT